MMIYLCFGWLMQSDRSLRNYHGDFIFQVSKARTLFQTWHPRKPCGSSECFFIYHEYVVYEAFIDLVLADNYFLRNENFINANCNLVGTSLRQVYITMPPLFSLDKVISLDLEFLLHDLLVVNVQVSIHCDGEKHYRLILLLGMVLIP